MNRVLTVLSLLAAFTVHAQQPAYRDFDVQQPAEPQGGLKALNQFMAVNIRKPFMAQVANSKSLVILQGVVEPDGRIADVSVIRSLRPDCDREAMRVFALFNAWKPAQKDGKAVRQVITIPVPFRSNEPVMYENGVAIRYFNNAFQSVTSPDSAVIRFETPTDTLGIPTGNLVFFKRDNKKWKQEGEIAFFRNPIRNLSAPASSLFVVGHRDENLRSFGTVYDVDNRGAIYNERVYDVDRKMIFSLTRNHNQLVTKREVVDDNQSIHTTWYDNGQVKFQLAYPKRSETGQIPPPQMLAYWDSTGTQIVNEGNGQVTLQERVQSTLDTNQYTLFTEQGLYEKGLKQGRWTGRKMDSSHWYEERYDNGKLTTGKATYAGRPDTLLYTTDEQPPEFVGGMNGLSRLLASNIRYPAIAQKAGAQGKVFVSFVINTDGSLTDIVVLKGIGFGCDEEATRVIKLMNGKWKPGIQRGRPVRVKYNLPINFALN